MSRRGTAGEWATPTEPRRDFHFPPTPHPPSYQSAGRRQPPPAGYADRTSHRAAPMPPFVARRHFLRDCGYGVGKAALAGLLAGRAQAQPPGANAPDPLAPKRPHFPATAKAVIHLFMAGAPSQLELFDYKPELQRRDGEAAPDAWVPTGLDPIATTDTTAAVASSERCNATAVPSSSGCARGMSG